MDDVATQTQGDGSRSTLSLPVFLGITGLTGMAISTRIAGIFNASPEFYGLYNMDSWAIAAFLLGLCGVLPAALGTLGYAIAKATYLRPLLALYFVLICTLTLSGILRDIPGPAGGWVILSVTLVLSSVVYYAFLKIKIVQVFLMATALGLPATLYESYAAIQQGSAGSSKAAEEELRVSFHNSGRLLPHVVFLIFDELPLSTLLNLDGRIHQIRFPHIRALADRSYWFSEASTVSCNTPTAVPGILSGNLFGSPNPSSPQPNHENYPHNLISVLSDRYRLHVVENLTQLCPPEACPKNITPWYSNSDLFEHIAVAWLHATLPTAFAISLPDLDPYWMEARAKNAAPDHKKRYAIRVGQLEEFVESIAPNNDKPSLYIGHFLLPHAPFDLLPDGTSYFRGLTTYAINGKAWDLDQPHHVQQSYYRHMLQAMYVDKLVGEIVERLHNQGMYDETIIVISSDHGVSFVPGDTRRVTNDANYPNLIAVPMIIKGADQTTGREIRNPAETIDILPTLLGLIGADVAADAFDGRDLLADSPAAILRRTHFCSRTKYSYYDLDLKAKLLEQVSIRDRLFGTARDQSLNMGFAGKPGWIGLSLDEVGTIVDSDRIAMLEQILGPKLPPENFVPIYLNGAVKGGAPFNQDRLLYVATLNDRIASVMPGARHRSGTDGVISLMLQSRFLQKGINKIFLYAVDNGKDGPVEFFKLNLGDRDSGLIAEDISFTFGS